MFCRGEGARTAYRLGLRETDGAYLDGSNSYRLRVPLLVPAQLFWSVTIDDAVTRSQDSQPAADLLHAMRSGWGAALVAPEPSCRGCRRFGCR
ncbi:hypothetical protein DSM104299_04115 [Baekduia alba]|nr:hypothetical protein DSM104299_04115 [Baekduia alba]